MRVRRQTWMSVLVALAAMVIGGCATRSGMEMLETKLREQEDHATDLEQQLTSVRADLKVAREEAAAHREQLKASGRTTLVSEQAEVLYRAEGIKFNPLLTSGADLDGQPGDEALSVLLMPVDVHGELIKLVGAIELEVLDLDKPRAEQRVGFWSFTAAEVRDHWHRGLMAGGYLFKLDWQQPPTAPELTLHGRMTAPDGRKFNTTLQFRVKPPAGAQSPVAAVSHEVKAPAAKPRAKRKRPPPEAETPAETPEAEATGPVEIEARRLPPPEDSGTPLRTSDRWTEADRPRLR